MKKPTSFTINLFYFALLRLYNLKCPENRAQFLLVSTGNSFRFAGNLQNGLLENASSRKWL